MDVLHCNPDLKDDSGNQHLRLLSAGCGEGEEAFDMAFECAEHFGLDSSWKVDGRDIRHDAIDLAKLDQWEFEDCAVLPQSYLNRWLQPRHNGLKILPELRAKMDCHCQNLLHFEQQNAYEVIFCRNVIMDMEKRSGVMLIEKLMSVLKPNGYLIVSRYENLKNIVTSENLLSPQIARKF